MGNGTDEQAAWVQRCLGIAVGGRAGRGVAYRKLLLRWRDAQALLGANLATVGKTLLARQDVQADPRLADIEHAVSLLPKLVPAFAGDLEDSLDAALSATDDATAKKQEAHAIAAIDRYRSGLAGARALMELESFAAGELKSPLPLASALDAALGELRTQLLN
jgi:hypothetical protein